MKKTVLLTGASKGIGRALAQKLLSKGYYVIGTSRTQSFDFNHKNFFPLKLDLSDPRSIENTHKNIFTNFDCIDILINNAGIGPDLDTENPKRDSFGQTFDVNVSGTVFFTEPLIELIPKSGVILTISSKMGSIEVCELTDSVAYRMSKSALNMYTKILSNRLENKIRVASIHPGWVKTTITESSLKNARLTAEESAKNIYAFLESDFNNGTFWDSERNTQLQW